MPVLHERLIGPVIPPQLRQVVCMILAIGKQRGEAGQASVNGIADNVNDARLRQCQMNETNEEKIRRHLVGDVRHIRC